MICSQADNDFQNSHFVLLKIIFDLANLHNDSAVPVMVTLASFQSGNSLSCVHIVVSNDSGNSYAIKIQQTSINLAVNFKCGF